MCYNLLGDDNMKLLFKQRLFSWFDSYDIFNENDEVVFSVEGQFSLGHCLHIYDQWQNHVGTIKEEILTFLPKFNMFVYDEYIGRIYKEFSLFKPIYHIECNDWSIEGDWLEWDYQIKDKDNHLIATISKEIFHWTDTYIIDIVHPEDALYVLMVILSIDAEKCSRQD